MMLTLSVSYVVRLVAEVDEFQNEVVPFLARTYRRLRARVDPEFIDLRRDPEGWFRMWDKARSRRGRACSHRSKRLSNSSLTFVSRLTV